MCKRTQHKEWQILKVIWFQDNRLRYWKYWRKNIWIKTWNLSITGLGPKHLTRSSNPKGSTKNNYTKQNIKMSFTNSVDLSKPNSKHATNGALETRSKTTRRTRRMRWALVAFVAEHWFKYEFQIKRQNMGIWITNCTRQTFGFGSNGGRVGTRNHVRWLNIPCKIPKLRWHAFADTFSIECN